jgi:hypothetical protein
LEAKAREQKRKWKELNQRRNEQKRNQYEQEKEAAIQTAIDELMSSTRINREHSHLSH